jgi:microcystin-dependent protein
MSSSFIGQIMVFAGNFAPAGWALCDGRLLKISDNDALFKAIGTSYGGDGTVTFALPDLRGRVPLGQGARDLACRPTSSARRLALKASRSRRRRCRLMAISSTP